MNFFITILFRVDSVIDFKNKYPDKTFESVNHTIVVLENVGDYTLVFGSFLAKNYTYEENYISLSSYYLSQFAEYCYELCFDPHSDIDTWSKIKKQQLIKNIQRYGGIVKVIGQESNFEHNYFSSTTYEKWNLEEIFKHELGLNINNLELFSEHKIRIYHSFDIPTYQYPIKALPNKEYPLWKNYNKTAIKQEEKAESNFEKPDTNETFDLPF